MDRNPQKFNSHKIKRYCTALLLYYKTYHALACGRRAWLINVFQNINLSIRNSRDYNGDKHSQNTLTKSCYSTYAFIGTTYLIIYNYVAT